jgi:anaerobic dimethyl sulfoxide reductase subunit A
MRRIPISCNKDCGGGCPLTAVIENGRLLEVLDNPAREHYMRGCIKGYRTPEMLYHPDRLTRPMRRTGARGSGQFEPITWEEAYDRIAEVLQHSRARSNGSEIMRIGGSGSCRGALHNTATLSQRFLSLVGDYTDTRGNYSSEVVDFVNPYLFGTDKIGIDVRTVRSSSCVILWGYNPFDTRFGCEAESVFRELRSAGTPCYVIDPRKTASVALCGGTWVGIRPGTDSVLAAALCYLLLTEDPDRLDRVRAYAEGADEFADYITGRVDRQAKTPAYAQRICGVPEELIHRLYEQLASEAPAAILPGLSVQRVLGGENTQRLLVFLQLLAGNTGQSGGSSGAGQWNAVPKVRCGSISALRKSPHGVPVYRWADAVIQGTEGGYPTDVRLLYNTGGNFLVQSSDTKKVLQAIERTDMLISHDMFMTPTCRYSDLILPPAMFPEREDIVFSNSGLLFYSHKVVEPPEGVPTDYEIFSQLSRRLGFEQQFTEGRSEAQWLDHFLRGSEVDDVEHFRDTGFWCSDQRMYIGLSDFISDPVTHALHTGSGRIELTSRRYVTAGGDFYPLVQRSLCSSDYPLQLITPHPRYRIHSQNQFGASLQRLSDDRLWMHPEDAARRGIEAGERVRISSEQGYTDAIVSFDRQIMSGVVSKDEGCWYPEGGDEPGDCNRVSSDTPTSPAQGSRTHSIAVEVHRLRQMTVESLSSE